MRHIKQYEELTTLTPEIGDYVLMKTCQENIEEYISTHIGQIAYIHNVDADEEYDGEISVEYKNVPYNIKNLGIFDDSKVHRPVRTFATKYLMAASKNKEDIEAIISANKYNI